MSRASPIACVCVARFRSERRSAVQAPSLSVCMFVRDEAAVLPRCIASLSGRYDELCVIDTGSCDGTVEYLRGLGAQVRIDTSCNGADGAIEDFARARDAALAIARCDWVLQIDADEVLEADDGALSRAIAHAMCSVGGGCVGVGLRSDGAEWVSGRLFRRADARGYRSPIHEYLEYDGAFTIAHDIIVRNLPNKRGKESADARNTRILRAALARDSDNARLWHFLGNEHRRTHRDREAAECYARALEIGSFALGRYHSAYYLGCCRLILGELDAAIDAARTAIRIDPGYAEGHCLLADALQLQGQTQSALAAYRDAMACGAPPVDAVMAVQRWAYDEHPRAQIAMLERKSGGGS
ncbi:MAG: glycosyltransferase [Lysobacteraceae bacterium]|nr:MAG: glycosyltransferase [Xanthomonadaceae bacterium]